MKRRVVGLAVLGLAGLVGSSALAAAPSAYSRSGTTERVSVASNGGQSTLPPTQAQFSGNARQDMTPDGRYVVFDSYFNGLVRGYTKTGTYFDVYRHDRKTGETKLVSAGAGGSPAQVPSQDPNWLFPGSIGASVSADGRYIAFASNATNLVPGDTNGRPDVFVRDMVTGRTERVSIGSNGAQGNARTGEAGRISSDGRYVAFSSEATNLGYAVPVGASQVYVRDLEQRRTRLVSLNASGQAGDRQSFLPSISASGRFLAYTSEATNLVAGSTAGQVCNCPAFDVYWADLKTGETRRVSVASDGAPASYAAFPSCSVGASGVTTLAGYSGGTANFCTAFTAYASAHAISADGHLVTFSSTATNLVPNDANFSNKFRGEDVFVHDVLARRTERVSVTAFGGELAKEASAEAALSPDGRFVGFFTAHDSACVLPQNQDLTAVACALLPTEGTALDTTAGGQVDDAYVYDRLSGSPELMSMALGGRAKGNRCDSAHLAVEQPGDSRVSALSAGGRYVTIVSNVTNLVSGDTNDACDVFVRDRGPAVGVGALTGTQPTSSPAPGCGLPVCPPLPTGASLQQARVIPRQGLQDLFIRWDVSRMAPVAGAPAGGLLYELRFASGGQHYAVRAQRVVGADLDAVGGASFGLFRETGPGVWTHVASLKGGYGTIGDSVVAAVPLSLLGGSAQLTDVMAYTAVGSYLSGPTKVLDSLRLS